MIQWLKFVDNIDELMRHRNQTMNINGQQYVVLFGASVTQRLDSSYSSRLDLYNLVETDTGTYLCLATNSVGFNLLSTHIIVLTGRGAETVNKKLIQMSSTATLIPVIVNASVLRCITCRNRAVFTYKTNTL